ncbi:MAG: ATP-dependent DNA ligase [Thermoplasmata archaeon]
MRFAELARAYEQLEATTKRLEMRSILVELIRSVEGPELGIVLYLSQGLLRPEYEGVELGVAGSLALKALARATGEEEAAIARQARTSGDLGTTAAELLESASRREEAKPLEVPEVYARLLDVARANGAGSQEAKVAILEELLRRANPLEGKYLLRFVLGTLRVGVREMTMLDALAERFAPGEKPARHAIEAAFNMTSDLGLIAERLAAGGIPALERLGLTVGRPIRPMLAERSNSLADILERMGGRAALEYKYDGLRVQAHIARDGSVRLFSRRLEEIGPQFPDLIEALGSAIGRRPAIIEGECAPIDPTTDELRPFQEVSRRRGRKRDLDRMQEEVPVALFAFDVLMDGGEAVYQLPFPERRRRLETLLVPNEGIRLAEDRVVTSLDEATRFFDEAVAGGAEGVMAKSLQEGSSYQAGARGFWWIKYKREYVTGLADSIDGVIVGAFSGRGRRGGRFGAFLLAVYNARTQRYESFCKVGSGFDDAALVEMPRRLHPHAAAERPPDVDTGIRADAWFRPAIVIEVRGAELTLSPIHRAGIGRVKPEAGLALRFPRFTGRYRDDKGPTDATTTDELLELYRSQSHGAAPAADAVRLGPKT